MLGQATTTLEADETRVAERPDVRDHCGPEEVPGHKLSSSARGAVTTAALVGHNDDARAKL